MLAILTHTPLWVFVLFFALLVFGYAQSRDRRIHRPGVSIPPTIMCALSCYGVISAFGANVACLLVWVGSLALATSLGARFMRPRGVTFCSQTRKFSIPGSWLPLCLMMGIFFTKYVVGVILAMHLPLAGETAFMGTVCLAYGVLGGCLLARARGILRAAPVTLAS